MTQVTLTLNIPDDKVQLIKDAIGYDNSTGLKTFFIESWLIPQLKLHIGDYERQQAALASGSNLDELTAD